jgi:hypothetical protein
MISRSRGVTIQAEAGGQLDPQPLVVQSVGVLIGSPSSIVGKLPGSAEKKQKIQFGFDSVA